MVLASPPSSRLRPVCEIPAPSWTDDPVDERNPMTDKSDRAPVGTGLAGRKLWRAVTASYDLEEHERLLLREAVRTADLIDRLEALVVAEGAVVDSPQGQKAHPAAVEGRQQRITLARLLAALRLPAGEEEPGQQQRRPQRRTGVRGVHRLDGPA